jgi:hypothetical protein
MVLINAIIDGTKSMEDRIIMREEFVALGILNMIIVYTYIHSHEVILFSDIEG